MVALGGVGDANARRGGELDARTVAFKPQPVGANEEDSVTVLTRSQANRMFGETAECPATENVKRKLSVSERGDCEFFLRPDDPDDTDVYYYRFMTLYTKHTRQESFSFDTQLRGIRPVIRIASAP